MSSVPLCRCAPGVCELHPSWTTCGMRAGDSRQVFDVPVYITRLGGVLPKELIDRLLEETPSPRDLWRRHNDQFREAPKGPVLGEKQHTIATLAATPFEPVRGAGLTDTVWLGPGAAPSARPGPVRCLHRYVRPEIPARMLMTPGEHTTEALTRCLDCNQALGVKVTITIELVPVP